MITLTLAWRNLFKRNRQSLILLMAISIGLAGLIFLQAMMDGFYDLMIRSVVDTSMGYIQVHEKDYLLKQDIKQAITDVDQVTDKISRVPHVKGVSPRVLVNGFFSSPESSNYGRLYGVNPLLEDTVTVINGKLVNGKNLEKDDMYGAFIGQALADKLKLDIDDKIVIQSKDVTGNVSGSAFRVRGTFRTPSKDFDKTNVYITLDAARKMLGLKNEVQEIAVRVDAQKNVNKAAQGIITALNNPGLEVKTWQQLDPLLTQEIEMSNQFSAIFYLIVFVALAFGIINAYLMEIFDRIKEFGIMMSLGVKPSGIFAVLMVESVLLAVAGAVLGSLLGIVLVNVILNNQLNLGEIGKGMEYMGLSRIIPLIVTKQALLLCSASTMIAVILSTVYPAIRASLFKPVEAIRQG